MKNKKLFVKVLVLVVVIALIFGGYIYYKSYAFEKKIPELTYLNVCGKDIAVKRGKRIYKIDIDSCILKYENGGWAKLINYEFDDDSKAGWVVSKEEPGQYIAYDFISFDNTKNSTETYDYYISVYFSSPLVKEPIPGN